MTVRRLLRQVGAGLLRRGSPVTPSGSLSVDSPTMLVTVGTELPFDRLIVAIDDWAGRTGARGVFAQIGRSDYRPQHIAWAQFVEAPTFERLFRHTDLVVAHAGMGTVLAAAQHGKPLLVMPRRATLGEHRNDHQLASARRLFELGRVDVAFDEEELIERLNSSRPVEPGRTDGEGAEPLVEAIRLAIERLT